MKVLGVMFYSRGAKLITGYIILGPMSSGQNQKKKISVVDQ